MTGVPQAPAAARRLLEIVLPDGVRSEAMLGDLQEEFVTRTGRGAWKARAWYWREALFLGLRYGLMRRRSTGTGRPPASGQGGGTMLETVLTNLRYSVRRLARSPFFTGVAVLSLGLGIGANTAVFSLVNAVVLRDLPYENPQELVDVYYRTPGFTHGVLSYPDFRDLIEASDDVFSGWAGSQLTLVQTDAEEGVRMLTAEAVSGGYFDVLGIRPLVGRLLGPEDDVAPGAHPVVVLSHGYWDRRFASDPEAVGTELRLGGRPYTIVGVAPREYRGIIRGLEPELYVPLMMYEALLPGSNAFEERRNHSLFAKARLIPSAGIVQAQGLLDRATVDFRDRYPEAWTGADALVAVRTTDVIMNPMIDRVLIPASGMIMGVVGLVLLIACANLASFLLARATDRRREIAVRLALGAGRARLVGQLLTETVVLALLGGAAGIAIAVGSLRLLLTADLPLPLPITVDASLDGTVLAFTLTLSLMAGLFFGLAPSVQATDPDVSGTLRDEAAGGGRGRAARLRNALVVGQVAVSVVLLVAAGLFLRSLDASRRIDPGFGDQPAGILELVLPDERYPGPEATAFLDRLEDRIAALPGVRSVGATSNLHLNPTNTSTSEFVIDGVPPPEGQDFHALDFARIDEGYPVAAGLRLVGGRGFMRSDGPDSEPVVMVNEAFVKRFFPDGDALGRSIREYDGGQVTIVGVVATARIRQLGEAPRPFVYGSLRQSRPTFVTVVASTSADPERTALAMFGEARALDPEIMVYSTKTMERHLAVMLLPRRLGAVVVSVFAVLALILATIGLYGIVSYAVSSRVREVGIRLSLGADAGGVAWMLTRSGIRLVALGGVIGLIASALVTRLLGRLLFGVPPLDPVTFLGVPVLFAVVATVASWVPAHRATRVDPVRALRSE
jgi:predicted permease